MGRPTSKELLDKLIATIREESPISVNKLQAKFTWTDYTFENILAAAIDGELVTKGQGGGGGVVRMTELASVASDDGSEERFVEVLRELTSNDPTQSVKSEELQTRLGLSPNSFKAVRARVQAQQRISLRKGPGAYISLTDAGATNRSAASPKNEQVVGVQQPPAAQDTPIIPNALRRNEMLSKERLFGELSRERDRSNHDVLKSLGWNAYEFWQTRTELVDEGRIEVAHLGDAGLVGIPTEHHGVALDSNVGMILGHLLDDLENSADAKPMKISSLATRLGGSEEQVVVACSRLLRMNFIEPIDDAVILTERLVVRDAPNADVVTFLNNFGDDGWGAEDTLAKRIGWDAEQTRIVAKKCIEHTPPLVEKMSAGIYKMCEAATSFMRNAPGNPGAPLSDSPEVFRDLHRDLRTKNVTPFIGAGASSGAGLPGWDGLLRGMVARMERSEIRDEMFELLSTNLMQAADAIMMSIGKTEFNEVIRKKLEIRTYPSGAIHVVLGLLKKYFHGVVTTNLDSLLEKNLGWDPAIEVAGNIQDPAHKVIHVHGVSNDPDTWVLTRRQYNKKYYGNTAYADAVKSLFLNNILMFVGYGMKDYELDLILDRLEGAYTPSARPKHYFFMRATEARPYFLRRLSALGMRPILFREFKDLPILLARLALPLPQ